MDFGKIFGNVTHAIGNTASALGGAVHNVQNYFQQPNPYPHLASPIPKSQQITTKMPPGYNSPVPQSNIVPHQAGPSAFQQSLNDFGSMAHSDIQKAQDTWSNFTHVFQGSPMPQVRSIPPVNTTHPAMAPTIRVQQPQQAQMPQIHPMQPAQPQQPQQNALQGANNNMQDIISRVRQFRPGANNLSDQQIAGFYKQYGDKLMQGIPQLTPTQAPTPTIAQPNPAFQHFTTAQVPQQYSGPILQAAQSNGVDPNIIASLLYTESGFNPHAMNQNRNAQGQPIPGNYDRGIAQINSVAHPEISDQQAFDPAFAINYASKLLGAHIKNLGMQRGIAAYNVGEGGAQNLGPQGKAYLDRITHGLSPALRKKYGL